MKPPRLIHVYGDIAVRVNEDYGSVNTVQCTALVPLYVNTDSSMDNHGAAGGIAFMEKCFEESYCTMDSIYSSVVPEMSGTSGVFSAYDRFVKDNYTEIPYELSTRLSGFMGDLVAAVVACAVLVEGGTGLLFG